MIATYMRCNQCNYSLFFPLLNLRVKCSKYYRMLFLKVLFGCPDPAPSLLQVIWCSSCTCSSVFVKVFCHFGDGFGEVEA